MKRFQVLATALIVVAALTVGCSDAPTAKSPGKAAERAMKYVKGHDYFGLMKTLYVEPDAQKGKTEEQIDRDNDLEENILRQLFEGVEEKRGRIKDFKTLSEDISGNQATVKMEVEYEKVTESVTVTLQKDHDEWLVKNIK